MEKWSNVFRSIFAGLTILWKPGAHGDVCAGMDNTSSQGKNVQSGVGP